MPYNNSYLGTAHMKNLANKALESPQGIAIRFAEKGAAIRIRQQFHSMRTEDRRFNKKLYPEGNPKHGVSIYDALETKLEEQGDEIILTLQRCSISLEGVTIIDIATNQEIKKEDL